MKTSSSIILAATLALLASVSAQTAEPPATRWCKAFAASCSKAADTVCGVNREAKWNCKSSFNVNVCQSYEVVCNCIPTGGAVTAASQVALINTFQVTNGACQNVPMGQVTSTPVTTAPPATSGVAPPPITGALPAPTSSPTPTRAGAGTINSNSALAAVVAMGAAVLAL